MKLNENLFKLRQERNLSQDELAKAIGVTQRSISYWENETNEPKASYLIKLALFFNVTTDELLGISDESGRKTFFNNK